MTERRCTHKCGDWNCGSYQFNLYKDNIDQGNLCDVHYWQTRAQKAEATSKEPSAEDWVILRVLDGWAEDMGDLRHDITAQRTVHWLVDKLGKQTVLEMTAQLKEERQA
jgi:hypothetical protein